MRLTKITVLLSIITTLVNGMHSFAEEDYFARKRQEMVAGQIIARGVSDKKVLEAMREVKRHLFVPAHLKEFAYDDTPLPIGYGQTISQPYIVAYMTEKAGVGPEDRVLEIGAGSGYQAAVLAGIAKEVYSIEIIKELADEAGQRLQKLGYKNVYIKHGDGYLGWPEQAPFDAIIVTAAPNEVPDVLVGQLKVGGRMVVPVGSFYQELYLIEKTKDGFTRKRLLPVRFVPMIRGNKNLARTRHSARPCEVREDSVNLSENLKRHVAKLSQDIGERNFIRYKELLKAADYIAGGFKEYGYAVKRQAYTVEGRSYENIISVKPGRRKQNEIIVVGAHYDSVAGSPGANDNASGVAALLEIAGLLSGRKTERTVKFIAFVNEEPPFFLSGDMGSRHYAKRAREQKEDIKAMISLETIGYYSDEENSQSYPLFYGLFYPSRANFISVVGNLGSWRLVKKMRDTFRKNSRFNIIAAVAPNFVPGVNFSDQDSFWRYGYKACMVTDTAFYRYPYYHTKEDTPDKINYAKLTEVTKGIFWCVYDLAER